MPKTKNKEHRITIPWLNKMSITNRITLMYGSIFAFVFVLTSVFLMVNASFYYRDLSREELLETADKVADFISSGGEITENALSDLIHNKYIEVRVINLNNLKQNQTAQDQAGFQPPPFKDASKISDVKEIHQQFPKIDKTQGTKFMSYEKLAKYGDIIYLIQVFRRDIREQQILQIFAIVCIGANVIGIIGMFLIGKYISKIMLKPIVHISQTAERISIEDLSRRIHIDGPDDEVKKLAITFNEMIGRLEQSFQKQNQFISDASHELRTPISVVQGYANLMDRWGKSDPEVLQESIDSIKAETEHMGTLVKKLLFLAKDEENKKQINKQPLLLHHVAAEVVREVAVIELDDEHYKNPVVLVEESQKEILADYDLIKQLIWIFIENGLKYSKNSEGPITIRTFDEQGYSCLSVKDSGIGIDHKDLPYIFERFYRADKSRSKEIPGTGLGLSIAKWIIQQHKAEVTVESKLGEGTEFIVKFPIYNLKRM